MNGKKKQLIWIIILALFLIADAITYFKGATYNPLNFIAITAVALSLGINIGDLVHDAL